VFLDNRFSSEEIKGKLVTSILPKHVFGIQEDEKDANLIHGADSDENDYGKEIFATHKDGTQFSVTLSLSKSGSMGAIFIRDVREIKGYQQLIENNEILLLKMLPKSIALRLKDTISNGSKIKIADKHDDITIMFVDVDKFTQHTKGLAAQEIADLLNTLVTAWDKAAMLHGVEKIKTIGDIYMAVCGCPEKCANHAVTMIKYAEAVLKITDEFNQENQADIHVRIGINSGPVVAGVLGLSKVTYDLWGSSVNMASRMQSSGIVDTIQITQSTYEQVKSKYPFIHRGKLK